MNALGWTLFTVPCLALAAVSLSPTTSAHPGPQSKLAQDEGSNAAAWRERLAGKDLEAREQAFDELVSRAARSDEARAELDGWSKDESDLEFAWTCRLALREAKSRDHQLGAFGAFGAGEDPFESLRQRMFGSHGLGSSGGDPFGSFLLLDPRERDGALSITPFGAMPNGAHLQSESEGFSLQMGPDGVKVRVKKDVNGEVKEEEYTAKTLEELLAAHPELADRVHGGGGRLQFGLPHLVTPQTALRTDKLGVYVPEETEPGSQGLRILRVQPGSLAEKLGLGADQVVVSINGHAIVTRDDISTALRERAPDAALEVEVRDPDGKVSTKSWTPDGTERGIGRPFAPRTLGGTRKI
ncbi:MAG TPA: PDZ domain-containing protein [Planctomycetota bacterium]|nr:PDZ domain-containing protein [Planctomycetota bacterium]